MELILTNGDSWTGGIYLGSKNKLWPGQLAQHCGSHVVNLAIGGASNQRIFRTTLEFLYDTKTMPTCIIIGWTSLLRYEITHNSGNYIRLTPIGVPQLDDDTHIKNYNHVHELYYSQQFNQELNYTTFVNNLYILSEYCRYKNIKLLNFFSFEGCNETALEHNLKDTRWIIPPCDSMRSYLKNKHFDETVSNHTDQLGQIFWASLVLEKLNKLSTMTDISC